MARSKGGGPTPAAAEKRRDEARSKIEAKLEVLRRFKSDGVPDGAYWPSSMEQFRVWEDPALGLNVIGSKSTITRPWNQELKDEVLRLFDELQGRVARRETRRSKGDRQKEEIDRQRDLITILTNQLHETQHKLEKVTKEKDRAERRVTDLKEELARRTRGQRQFQGLTAV